MLLGRRFHFIEVVHHSLCRVPSVCADCALIRAPTPGEETAAVQDLTTGTHIHHANVYTSLGAKYTYFFILRITLMSINDCAKKLS